MRRRADRELDDLRAEARRGEPLHLMLGTGEILGLWAVLRIGETGSRYLPGGVPRKVGFEVELAWYGDDGGGVEFLGGDTAAARATAGATLPQPLPAQLALELPAELADSLPAALPEGLADALPADLPEGLASGRGGPFGAVLSALAEGRAPLPSAVGRLRGQVREVAGRLDLEKQVQPYLRGLPGRSQAEDLARAASRAGALEAVLKPPRAVLRHVDGLL